jgi:hypothetical protein
MEECSGPDLKASALTSNFSVQLSQMAFQENEGIKPKPFPEDDQGI